MRLPGTILQGILARSALAFLRIYLGGTLAFLAWPGIQEGYSRDIGAELVAWLTLLVGITLMLGLLTRLSAAGALVIAVGSMLQEPGRAIMPSTPELGWAAIAVALMVGAAGRTFGLDSFLARRWARSPFW
jgi:uncharacterized membrane protein YphA (DoxX/SURF4 family)